MARTASKTFDVTKLCASYAEDLNCPVCEVVEFTDKHAECREWIHKQYRENWFTASRTQIHHIWKRSDSIVERHWFCSLVQAHTAVHNLHDRSPHVLELCSIRAKMERHIKWLERQEIFDLPTPEPQRLHWNFEAMSAACPNKNLERRVEQLKGDLRSSEAMVVIADELLCFIGSGDAK